MIKQRFPRHKSNPLFPIILFILLVIVIYIMIMLKKIGGGY